MLSDPSCATVLHREQIVIGNQLVGASHPVAEGQEEAGGPTQFIHHRVTQTLIIHRRHPVAVIKHKLFKEVENKERGDGNREQDRQAEAKHHGDEADVHDGGILVVHVVDWAEVQVRVTLDGRLFRHERGASAEAAVEYAEQDAHAPVHQEFDDWVVRVEDHS